MHKLRHRAVKWHAWFPSLYSAEQGLGVDFRQVQFISLRGQPCCCGVTPALGLARTGHKSTKRGPFPSALKGQGVGGSHQSLEKLPVFDKAVKTAFSPPTLFLVLEDE